LFAAGFPDTNETEIDVARSLSGETDVEREKRKKLKKAYQGRGAK
jgi:hypothetical protein